MKKFLVLLLLPVSLAAQKKYTVSGELPGLKEPGMAYLSYGQGADAFKDSVEIANGKFQFKGRVAEPVTAFLTVTHRNTPSVRGKTDYLAFFLENSDITVTGADSVRNAELKGSVSEKEKRELDAAISLLTNTIIQLNNQFRGKPKDEAYQKASDSVTFLVAEIKNIRRRFVESHLNSFMGLYTFNTSILDSKFDPAKEEPLFAGFSPEMKASGLGERTREKIEIARRRQTGIAATDFTQTDLDGKPFTLSSLRGKYVLVDFWASWCVPCRAENPNLVKAYQELKGKNFEVVGISLDGGKEPWVAAVKKDGLPWIHVCDLKGWQNAVAVQYGIASVPQNLLIDPKGIIIAKNLRGEDLTEKLRAIIK